MATKADIITTHDPMAQAVALQRWMKDNDLSFRAAAEELGVGLAYVQTRLDLLRAPKDCQELLKTKPESLIAIQRLGRIADAKLRTELRDRYKAGEITQEDILTIWRERNTVASGNVTTSAVVGKLRRMLIGMQKSADQIEDATAQPLELDELTRRELRQQLDAILSTLREAKKNL